MELGNPTDNPEDSRTDAGSARTLAYSAPTPNGQMQTIAIISDIHANLPALEAVVDDLDIRAPDAPIYHLGDLLHHCWQHCIQIQRGNQQLPNL